jgi:hypothetical protein
LQVATGRRTQRAQQKRRSAPARGTPLARTWLAVVAEGFWKTRKNIGRSRWSRFLWRIYGVTRGGSGVGDEWMDRRGSPAGFGLGDHNLVEAEKRRL